MLLTQNINIRLKKGVEQYKSLCSGSFQLLDHIEHIGIL